MSPMMDASGSWEHSLSGSGHSAAAAVAMDEERGGEGAGSELSRHGSDLSGSPPLTPNGSVEPGAFAACLHGPPSDPSVDGEDGDGGDGGSDGAPADSGEADETDLDEDDERAAFAEGSFGKSSGRARWIIPSVYSQCARSY